MAGDDGDPQASGMGAAFSDKEKVRSKIRPFSAARRWPTLLVNNLSRSKEDFAVDSVMKAVEAIAGPSKTKVLELSAGKSSVGYDMVYSEVDGLSGPSEPNVKLSQSNNSAPHIRVDSELVLVEFVAGLFEPKVELSESENSADHHGVDSKVVDVSVGMSEHKAEFPESKTSIVHHGVDSEVVDVVAAPFEPKIEPSESKKIEGHRRFDSRELPRRSFSAGRRWPMYCGRSYESPLSREQCLRLVAEKKNKARGDDDALLVHHGLTSHEQKPRSLVLNDAIGVGQKRMRSNGEASRHNKDWGQSGSQRGNFDSLALRKWTSLKGTVGHSLNTTPELELGNKRDLKFVQAKKQTQRVKLVSTFAKLEYEDCSQREVNVCGDHIMAESDEMVSSSSSRKKVRTALRMFHKLCRKFTREAESQKLVGRNRVDLRAHEILRGTGEYDGEPVVGAVAGVEVGDEFHYRTELNIIGLHYHLMAGIDYLRGSRLLATSVVSSGAYDDQIDESDVMIYTGEGGRPTKKKGEAKDQQLSKGNSALIKSFKAKTPVRVIRGIRDGKTSCRKQLGSVTYIYYGLYIVEKWWKARGRYGCVEFKFRMRRMEGQPDLAVREVRRVERLNVRDGVCVKDISQGKEEIPICAVNKIDNEKPPTFNYVTWMHFHTPIPFPLEFRGCSCVGDCAESSSNCWCIAKNGGEIPYNQNGAIVYSKPVIYECGPSCGCPPSCSNKVTQHGIKLSLELFKTETRGWGVRSLSSIQSGTFICEYLGEMLQESEVERRVGHDEYLFDIGRCYQDGFDHRDELISTYFPDQKCDNISAQEEYHGFTIDAALYGNVARFINHSCSPNLYAQNVLYDHDDKRLPHIMLFAAENIPPLQELTYHYNISVDQVFDRYGNIKRKACYCASSECTGRLY